MAEDLMERLRTLAHPCAEVLSDDYRLAQFIRLAHEMDGRLIDPTTLSEAVAAARAETERYKTALKLAMGLVQRCVGEGITFEEDDPLPEMESWKVAEAIAETLGIDMNSAAYVDLFKGPLTPGGRTDG